MNPVTQTIILSASTLRMLPHIAIYLLHRKDIDADPDPGAGPPGWGIELHQGVYQGAHVQESILLSHRGIPFGSHPLDAAWREDSEHLVSEHRQGSASGACLCHVSECRGDRRTVLLPADGDAG